MEKHCTGTTLSQRNLFELWEGEPATWLGPCGLCHPLPKTHCVCVCTCVHAFVHMYVCTCMCTYRCAHVHTYTRAHTCMCVCCVHVYVCAFICMCVCMYVCVPVHVLKLGLWSDVLDLRVSWLSWELLVESSYCSLRNSKPEALTHQVSMGPGWLGFGAAPTSGH